MEKRFKQVELKVAPGEGDGTRRFVISTGDVDRQGDILVPSGADLRDYRKNPVVLWSHSYQTPPIGKAKRIEVVGNRIEADVEFAPSAMGLELKMLVDQGFIRAASVGFDPIESEPRHDESGKVGWVYKRWALLEWSLVSVPAQPAALIQEAKSKGLAIPEVERSFNLERGSRPSELVLDLAEEDESLWKQLDQEGEEPLYQPTKAFAPVGENVVEIEGFGLVDVNDLRDAIREQIQREINRNVLGKIR